jgi:ethanolamine ammonia-lyase small subunit
MNFDPYRVYTQARVGLGHRAPAMPTKAWLLFAYHHACAADAVALPWAIHAHAKEIKELGITPEIISTKIAHRQEYLMRPDLGRVLTPVSERRVKKFPMGKNDVLIVVSNGLSSLAVKNHLTPLLAALFSCAQSQHLRVMKQIFLVENARIGLIDHLGDCLKPSVGIVIIGERPGLSAPDSLAVYLTYRPHSGVSDSERNCVSNIRPPFGLTYENAAAKTCYLIKTSLERKLSGVHLKEELGDEAAKLT